MVEVFYGKSVRPRSFFVEHLEKNYSESENFGFLRVESFLEKLRAHVERRANNTSHELVWTADLLGESEIREFVNTLVNQNVRRLKITVYEPKSLQFLHPSNDLLEFK